MRLFHVSESGDIGRFIPKPSSHPSIGDELVWAIDEQHLHNYLLPRDCPRVTFFNDGSECSLLRGVSARAVVAIERIWLNRARRTSLYIYELESNSFEQQDRVAGYYVSREAIQPAKMHKIDDPLDALISRDVELRVLPSLWKLHDEVAASSLPFSIIRMRNAQPRV